MNISRNIAHPATTTLAKSRIVILIGNLSLSFLKETQTMDMVLGLSVDLKRAFLIISNICCCYTRDKFNECLQNVSLMSISP